MNSQVLEPISFSGMVTQRVQRLLKHETIKLSESNFHLSKHQITLILEGYDL